MANLPAGLAAVPEAVFGNSGNRWGRRRDIQNAARHDWGLLRGMASSELGPWSEWREWNVSAAFDACRRQPGPFVSRGAFASCRGYGPVRRQRTTWVAGGPR